MKNTVALTDLEREFILTMMDFVHELPEEFDLVLRRLPQIDEEDFWCIGGFRDKLEKKLKENL
jgi:predicted nuclease of restriction endonuclease-like (RecB) superfamily